jgi:hypothetical protein
MSAQMPGAFDPNNPFSSQKGGQYDPGALQALYLRAQKGDLSARKYLQQLGVLGNQGQDIWANNDTQAGNFAPAINAWAQQTGSRPIASGGFAYQPAWATANNDPNFSRAWDSWFQTGGQGTDFQKVNPADPSQPGNTSKPSITGNPSSTDNVPLTGLPPSAGKGNPYGYAYSDPGQGLNIWGLYDGGRGYQGGDGLGLYQVGRDTAKGWGPNGQAETDRDRVWRMTLDAARAEKLDPGAQDPLTQMRVKQIFLDEIARLHRDYVNTPGLGAQAWANSAFAGYDKYLAPGSGQPAAPGAPGAPPPNPAGGPPVPGAPGAPPPTTYTDPVTGETKTYQGNLDPTQLAKNVALADPQNQDARLSYIMRQYGIDPTRAGLYTASLARSLSPQIEASNQLNGIFGDTNSIDTAQSNLDSLARSLAAPGGFARQQANARGILADPRLGNLAGGLSDPQMIDTLQTILSQAYAGSNPIYNQSRLGYFNQALGPGGAYGQYSLEHPQTGAPGYQHPLDWLKNTQWANLLAGY